MSQSHDLHRALLRPAVIHTLRAAGFHSTKPSVLDTLVNLAERHLLLLATTVAHHAASSHSDPIPTVSDVRMALTDAGVLVPRCDASAEAWKERMRKPLAEVANVPKAGRTRAAAEKRRRDEDDVRDVKEFAKWLDSGAYREVKRVAGLMPDLVGPGAVATGPAALLGGAPAATIAASSTTMPATTGTTAVASPNPAPGIAAPPPSNPTTAATAPALPAVGVGGSFVHAEDFLTVLKKKHSKTGDDSRLQGTVLGRPADDREVLLEGGPVQRIRDWRPKPEHQLPSPACTTEPCTPPPDADDAASSDTDGTPLAERAGRLSPAARNPGSPMDDRMDIDGDDTTRVKIEGAADSPD